MKKTALIGFIILPLFLLINTVALASNLLALTKISANAINTDYIAGQGRHYRCTTLNIEYELYRTGPNHVCEVYWTIDNWKTSQVAHANFDRNVSGVFGFLVERWKASVQISNETPDQWKYSFSCTDLDTKYEINLSPTQKVNSYGLSIRAPMETVETSDTGYGTCP